MTNAMQAHTTNSHQFMSIKVPPCEDRQSTKYNKLLLFSE